MMQHKFDMRAQKTRTPGNLGRATGGIGGAMYEVGDGSLPPAWFFYSVFPVEGKIQSLGRMRTLRPLISSTTPVTST